ncbi:uncharacterized protein DS421_16g552780 [Arachis hypogaea]|nr:uncharacterized protein DS421_16g552780 [Arachis hypogaea]
MGERCDFLEEISTTRADWIIKVYVVRMWYGPPRPNSSEIGALEIAFHGSKGCRIHCTIPKSVCRSLQYRVSLLQRSMVVHTPKPLFPFHPFTFRSIASILQEERLDQNFLFDVLAEVIGKENPKDLVTKQGQKSKQLGLLVEDLEKNSISCTLFGSLVDLIQPYLDGDKTEPLIVTFQLFREKEWNWKISIHSSFDTSNLHINPNIKEAELFKKSSYRFAIDELRKGICKVETIDNVLNASDIEEMFECDHCHKKAVQVDLRYKLQAYVSDATGSMCVVLWDTEASQILGLSATKVKESYSEDDSGNSYPKVLKTALDMKLILRINVKSSNLNGVGKCYSLDCTTDVYLGDDESVQGGQNPSMSLRQLPAVSEELKGLMQEL